MNGLTVLELRHEGQPLPWPRPSFDTRSKRPRVYVPAPVQAHRDELSWAMLAARRGPVVGAGRLLGLSAIFWRRGHVWADLDNLLKTVQDAANGVVWADDRQVVEYGRCRVRYGAVPARLELRVYEVEE